MANPNVSVIISVYNTEKYLKQCLDSVCNQTLKDIEIICVNDGFGDGYYNKFSSLPFEKTFLKLNHFWRVLITPIPRSLLRGTA
jgi:glycosyltransferase involved in cell wall biosynthesis